MSDKEHKEDHEKPHKHTGGGGHGHGGGSHEEHEGAPEWLISFADNVTLMMGFFVILLALNMASPKKASGGSGGEQAGDAGGAQQSLLDAAIAIRDAFNNPVNPDSTDPKDQELIRRIRERNVEGYARDPGLKGRHHDVQSIRQSDYYGLCGMVPFEDNSAVLTDAGIAAVKGMAIQLRGLRLIIEVRGHISAAEAFDRQDEGMRLSFDRVLAVAQVLAGEGVDWRQMHLIACADNDRITPRAYDNAGQRQNERVEVVVTEHVMPNYVPAAASKPAE